MYFREKNTLKSNRYYALKHPKKNIAKMLSIEKQIYL
jgi:hypothetical protein